jgi:uncharacterized membrane protein (DUF485 family)
VNSDTGGIHLSHNPQPKPSGDEPIDYGELASFLMKKQVKLSLRVAAIFLAMVFGLPLVNYYLPDIANKPVLGFTATWLFLGVLFYPITWLLSAYFVRETDRLEEESARAVALKDMERQ